MPAGYRNQTSSTDRNTVIFERNRASPVVESVQFFHFKMKNFHTQGIYQTLLAWNTNFPIGGYEGKTSEIEMKTGFRSSLGRLPLTWYGRCIKHSLDVRIGTPARSGSSASDLARFF
jgi:hypothetical protein